MFLTLYGIIGEHADDLDAKSVVAQIKDAEPTETIEVNINSGGGSVSEGLAIYNALSAHKGSVVVTIDGVAASMASAIAMAGTKIIMPENALMMVHDPFCYVQGNSKELRKTADDMDRWRDTLANIYAKRSRLPMPRVLGMMEAETWMTAKEAADLGLVDEIVAGVPMAAFTKIDWNSVDYPLPPNIKALQGDDKSEVNMTTPNPDNKPSPNTKRAKGIRAAVNVVGLSAEVADDLIDSGISLAEAKAKIIDMKAEAQLADDGGEEPRSYVRTPGVSGSFDDPAFKVNAMAEAVAARYIPNSKPSDPAREFMGSSILDMARDITQARGLYRVGMSKADIVKAAHTTSDFPELLLGGGNRILRSAYDMAQSGIKPACRERTADDFRALTTLRMGEFPELEEVPEGGEVKHGTTAETKESFKLASYAKIFSLSRQAIINDDLDAFGDFMRHAGRAAAQKEASLLHSLLTSNPTMAEDDTTLFHASHGNLADAGTVIDVTNLGEARKSLRTMTGLGSTEPINAEPAYLLVGPEKETEAEQVLASIAAAKVSDANPFTSKLQLLVEPRLGASNEWYVFASPANVPTIEYAYLSQAYGPQLETKDGFDVLGTEFRVLLDFGAGVADWRGAYKNPGA